MTAATLEHETRAERVCPSNTRAPELPRDNLSQTLHPSRDWVKTSLRTRLAILRDTRHDLAQRSDEIVAAIPATLARTAADTLVSELLPLLEAIRFLERNAKGLLASKRLGRRGLPFWLSGISTEIHRVPFGHVLVIGPSNYPLFLPGVQVLQALAAGNTVTWKSGLGGTPAARIVAQALSRAGLPEGALNITEDSVDAAEQALALQPDKVFFTGSASVARRVLEQLATTATPAVVELSGNDAVIVLPSADLDRVVAAIAFGMRLNGSATCMAPRRVLLVNASRQQRETLVRTLTAAFIDVPAVRLPDSVHDQLQTLLSAAELAGATIVGNPAARPLKPVLVLDAKPEMAVTQADIFAPVLSLMEVRDTSEVLAAQSACPLALTAAIFGDRRAAHTLAALLHTGTVTINDLIVPTADPRVPFGGRRASGYGVTRGAEGLLEMTAVKVVAVRRNRSTRQYEPTGKAHAALFRGIITAAHGSRFGHQWNGLKRILTAALEFKKK